MSERLAIEVAVALPERQRVVSLEVDAPCTVEQAIRQSGILDQFPEVTLERGAVGVHGRVVARDRLVASGDRVEIYRPLVADPKERRRRRAEERRRAASPGDQSSEPGSSR